MVCEDIKTWLMPFSQCDFPSVESHKFVNALEDAKKRALYFMKASPCQPSFGWGITEEELALDPSGQLQKALQLLTSAEFLSMYIGLQGQYTSLGEYRSPDGEMLKITAEDLKTWKEQHLFFRRQAEEAARAFIKNCNDGSGSTEFIRTYDFETLDRNYQQEHPTPYYNNWYA